MLVLNSGEWLLGAELALAAQEILAQCAGQPVGGGQRERAGDREHEAGGQQAHGGGVVLRLQREGVDGVPGGWVQHLQRTGLTPVVDADLVRAPADPAVLQAHGVARALVVVDQRNGDRGFVGP